MAYIAWNPDSTHLLACGPEGSPEVWLWNIDTEKCLKVSQSPEDVLTCCAWNKDGTKFVVSRFENYLFILRNFKQGWIGYCDLQGVNKICNFKVSFCQMIVVYKYSS